MHNPHCVVASSSSNEQSFNWASRISLGFTVSVQTASLFSWNLFYRNILIVLAGVVLNISEAYLSKHIQFILAVCFLFHSCLTVTNSPPQDLITDIWNRNNYLWLRVVLLCAGNVIQIPHRAVKKVMPCPIYIFHEWTQLRSTEKVLFQRSGNMVTSLKRAQSPCGQTTVQVLNTLLS